MRSGVGDVDPAALAAAGAQVQSDQLGQSQSRAVQQFDDRAVARGQPRIAVAGAIAVFGQGHRLVDRQRLGQRLSPLGRAHANHRVVLDHALLAPPAVQAAPGREQQRQAARRQAAAVRLCRPGAHVVRLHRLERDALGARAGHQPAQRQRVVLARAQGQAPLDLQMPQPAPQRVGQVGGGGGVHALGSSLVSAALATSPMRARKSVAMSAA